MEGPQTNVAAPVCETMRPFRAAQWRMVFAVMFCYLFFYTGRQTLGFAIPGIQAEFGVNKQSLGWVSAALLWSYALGQLINGNLGDKFGGRRVATAGALLSFLMNWATSFTTGVESLGFCWGINGYFQAMGWAPLSRLLSNWWAQHERGKVFGLFVFAAGMSSVLAYTTSLVVIEILHLNWRWIFRLPPILLLLGGTGFYLIAKEHPEDMGFVSPHDEVDRKSNTKATARSESSISRYRAVLRNWRISISGIAIGFQNAARYGLLVWAPVHFLGPNWSNPATHPLIDPRWISVALPVGMAVGGVTNGWISDHLFKGRRCIAIVLYMLLAAVTSLWMYTIPPSQFYLGIVVLFACGFFVYGPQASFWALCTDLGGHQRAGTAIGVLDFFAYLFAGLGEPLIGGAMDKTSDTSIVFLVVAGASLASAAFVATIRK
jgi:MFS transporter, OPA family, glycerol-3-phosphate transporter